MRLRAWPQRGIVWPAAALAFLFLLFAGCGGDETATPSSSSTVLQETQPETEPSNTAVALTPLPPQLVGTWTTVSGSAGSQQIRREYVFLADGRYAYTVGMCQSSTDCSVVSQESGYAQVVNGNLSLQPQTEPNDGPRTWPFIVMRDPNVGDVQLHIRLPDGQDDIFYFG